VSLARWPSLGFTFAPSRAFSTAKVFRAGRFFVFSTEPPPLDDCFPPLRSGPPSFYFWTTRSAACPWWPLCPSVSSLLSLHPGLEVLGGELIVNLVSASLYHWVPRRRPFRSCPGASGTSFFVKLLTVCTSTMGPLLYSLDPLSPFTALFLMHFRVFVFRLR